MMGVIKPDPRIYQMVEDDCGMPPQSLLFTDDRADNITAAARRGWRTHQFRKLARLGRAAGGRRIADRKEAGL
jgi:2-haloacid dehalogenase